jgi:hypothetical protein
MGWTTPKTWTAGEVLTSSDMNTYVRDNLSELGSRTFDIQTVALSSSSSSVLFSSIPQTHRGLMLEWYARSDVAGTLVGIHCRVNDSAAASYGWHRQRAVGATNETPSVNTGETFARFGEIPAGNADSGMFGSGELVIPSYRTSHRRVGRSVSRMIPSATTTATWIIAQYQFTFALTGAVTSLRVLPELGSFVAGSYFVLSARH